jgi:hypothetical protein
MMTWEHQAATLAQRTADLGLAGVLAKPVSPARLLERVNALLAGDHAAGSAAVAHVPLQGRLRGMRVPLVEDNEINQKWPNTCCSTPAPRWTSRPTACSRSKWLDRRAGTL